MTSTVAVVTPVHPPKYPDAYNLIASLPGDIPLYLMFTNQEERAQFDPAYLDRVHALTLTDYVSPASIAVALKNRVMPGFKQQTSLSRVVMPQYAYAIAIDAETQFFPDIDAAYVASCVKNFYAERRFYAGRLRPGTQQGERQILMDCADLFGNRKFLNHVTQGFNLYFWYSDVPIYEREDYQAFSNMEHIGFKDPMQMARIMSWNTFDFYLYAFFLLSVRGWSLVELQGFNFSLEHALRDDYQRFLNDGTRRTYTWIFHRAIDPDRPLPGPFLSFHHDRASLEAWRETNEGG